jgi:purine-binding chemotaxis protein CheW
MSAQRIDWAEIHQRMAAAEAAIARNEHATHDETLVILKARAKALARKIEGSSRGEASLEVVCFLLGQEKYGIESRYVREVCPLNDLTPLPGTPSFVLGIVNVHGQVLSVIDIRQFFDLPQGGVGDLDRLIVLQHDSMEFALFCNAILGVVEVPTSELQSGLPTLTDLRAEYLKGVTGDRVAILDGAKLLSDEKMIVREEA